MKEFDFITEKELRSKAVENELAIAKMQMVKELLLLDGTEFATTEMVARYYDAEIDTIKKIISRHKQEISSNGYRLFSKSEIEKILKDAMYEGEFKIPNRGMLLFPKKAILTIGLLLRDSFVANEIKRQLGLPVQFKLSVRNEMKFKKELDIAIENIRKNIRYEHFFNEDYKEKGNDLYKIISKAINSITTYEAQYSCCNGKYRIDFYFPKLNIAIEYDEKYHEGQKEKDKQREYEIVRDIYIDKYYREYSEEEIKEWGYRNKEELFDEEYKENQLDCSFDMTRFVRIKEDNEIEGLMYACSMIAITANSIIDSRGMSCKYDDLIN